MAKTKVGLPRSNLRSKILLEHRLERVLTQRRKVESIENESGKPAVKRKSEAGNLFKFGFTIKNDTGKYYPTDCSISRPNSAY